MKSWRRSLIVSLVFLCTTATVLAGCGGSKNGDNKTAEGANNNNTKAEEKAGDKDKGSSDKFELGSEPINFSFYGHYDWYTMPTWGGDVASKWIQENKKVNITAINSGGGEGSAERKLNTLIASKELPDVIWTEKGKDVERLREAGMLVPFDDYLDKYPNLKKWAGESTLNMLRSSDGKLYQFPNWYTSQPAGNAGYLLNSKVYKDLGSPKLETTDDLYNYLKAVKAKYPSMIPFEPDLAKDGQGLDILYSAFGEDHSPVYIREKAVPNGDKLTSIFQDPVYRESMQFASKLFREKLMDQDGLTQTKDQLNEKAYTGRFAIAAGASPTEYGSKGDVELKKKDPTAGYEMIWPIHKEGLDKNKIFAGSYNQLGWNVAVITKSAKDPEKIFAFLDWLTGEEGSRVIMWGPEGTLWKGLDEEGYPMFTDTYANDHETVSKIMDPTVNLQWVGNTVYIDKSKMKFEKTLPPEKQNWETKYQSSITWKTQYNATAFLNLAPMPDTEEGIIQDQVKDIFSESRAKALYAKNDEEVLAILDKAEKDAMSVGYEKLLAYKTQKWQENLKKIGE